MPPAWGGGTGGPSSTTAATRPSPSRSPGREGATVRVEPSGRVHVIIGSSSQGQGHETTMAQICAGVLGVPLEAVSVTTGRTDDLPYGTGTFASRIGAV